MFGAVLGKLRYLPPNAATASSMLLGLASVYLSTHGQFKLAAWFILWCVLLDKLDGTLARLMHAQSNFGVEFDSFADFCAFGLAPASLISQHLLRLPEFAAGTSRVVVFVGAAFYVVFAAGRLARYNVQTAALGDRLFFGLPSTLSGALIGSGYLVAVRYLPLVPSAEPWVALAPVVFFLNGTLMVTRFPLPKLRLGRARWWRYFQIANIFTVFVFTSLMFAPEYLFLLSFCYVLIGAHYGRQAVRATAAE
jgi:CDP-diacylglycerol--serine O-phosphatidyltransferase